MSEKKFEVYLKFPTNFLIFTGRILCALKNADRNVLSVTEPSPEENTCLCDHIPFLSLHKYTNKLYRLKN